MGARAKSHCTQPAACLSSSITLHKEDSCVWLHRLENTHTHKQSHTEHCSRLPISEELWRSNRFLTRSTHLNMCPSVFCRNKVQHHQGLPVFALFCKLTKYISSSLLPSTAVSLFFSCFPHPIFTHSLTFFMEALTDLLSPPSRFTPSLVLSLFLLVCPWLHDAHWNLQ